MTELKTSNSSHGEHTHPTITEIENEPAGRRLDSWVAEKVMGLKFDITLDWVSNYSTDISDAWRVVEKMWKLGWWVSLKVSKKSACWFHHKDKSFEMDGHWGVEEKEVCLSICKAALKVVMNV